MNGECNQFIKKIYICDIKDKKENNNNNVEIILRDDKKINFTFKDSREKNSLLMHLIFI